MKDLSRYRGCLVGGAAGDALGYPVEFFSVDRIKTIYGSGGITEYALCDGKALISDDTQMTLFTATGLLCGTTRFDTRGIFDSYPGYIWYCYKDWLKTQTAASFGAEKPQYSWLGNLPEMNQSREPGRTCLTALFGKKSGTIEKPINDSKGCGGVMRVAPIGLYLPGRGYRQEETDRIGAEAAALTHGHELGYLPAAMFTHIVSLAAHDPELTLDEIVTDAMDAVQREFPDAVHLRELTELTRRAVTLSRQGADDGEAIRMLGEGWVAEETLAIAVFCALKYADNFEKGIIAAVNHGGDSDSTGAVCGNILGAYLGIEAIPKKFIRDLELRDTILEVADDLFRDNPLFEYSNSYDPVWRAKYIAHTYPVVKAEK